MLGLLPIFRISISEYILASDDRFLQYQVKGENTCKSMTSYNLKIVETSRNQHSTKFSKEGNGYDALMPNQSHFRI
jgi:hypothetical protein